MYSTKLRQCNKQNGQVFLEFVLILTIIISISFGFMKGFRTLIGDRWQVMIQIIAVPKGSGIQIP
jgi:sugar phosphate permease